MDPEPILIEEPILEINCETCGDPLVFTIEGGILEITLCEYCFDKITRENIRMAHVIDKYYSNHNINRVGYNE